MEICDHFSNYPGLSRIEAAFRWLKAPAREGLCLTNYPKQLLEFKLLDIRRSHDLGWAEHNFATRTDSVLT